MTFCHFNFIRAYGPIVNSIFNSHFEIHPLKLSREELSLTNMATAVPVHFFPCKHFGCWHQYSLMHILFNSAVNPVKLKANANIEYGLCSVPYMCHVFRCCDRIWFLVALRTYTQILSRHLSGSWSPEKTFCWYRTLVSQSWFYPTPSWDISFIPHHTMIPHMYKL